MEWFIFAFLSAISWGILSILNKKILSHENALDFVSAQGIFLFIITLFLIPFVKFNNISWLLLGLTFIVSLFISLGIILMNKSLQDGQVSVVMPLMNTTSLFLLLIAFLVLGEIPKMNQYIGVFLVVLGAYMLEIGVKNHGFLEPFKAFRKSKSIHEILLAMFLFSISVTIDKLIVLKLTDFITYFFIANIFISINFITFDIYKNGKQTMFNNLRKDFKQLFLSSILYFFGQIIYMAAVAIPSSMISLIIPIKRTSSLFATIFGGKMFHEKNLLIKILSSIIMIWGAIFILL